MKRIGFWNGQLRVDSYGSPGSPRLNALRQLQKIDYSLLKELNELTSLLGVNFLGEVLVIPSLHLSETFWLTMPHEGSIGAMASSRKGVEAKMKRQ